MLLLSNLKKSFPDTSERKIYSKDTEKVTQKHPTLRYLGSF